MRTIFVLLLLFGVTGCKNDLQAKLGLGCFMEGKLCYDDFQFSNSYYRSLELSLGKKYKFYPNYASAWSVWNSCTPIDYKNTVCSSQELSYSIADLDRICKGELNILKFPRNDWKLKYYLIKLIEDKNPPYAIIELNNKNLLKYDLGRWVKKQKINERQEVLCPY